MQGRYILLLVTFEAINNMLADSNAGILKGYFSETYEKQNPHIMS